MRIISKFKDYYDSVQGVMYDSDILYFRKKEQLTVDKSIISFRNFMAGHNYISYIGFCGEVYPVLRFVLSDSQEKSKKYKKFTFKGSYYDVCGTAIHGIEAIAKYAFDNQDKKHYQHKESYIYGQIKENVNYLKKLDLFEVHKTPIYLLHSGHTDSYLTIAPELKEYNFQSVFDPYTAYQELVMWIGNQAVKEYPPQIKDDIVIRDSKGFDGWSFKNKWSEKKQRRSNKK